MYSSTCSSVRPWLLAWGLLIGLSSFLRTAPAWGQERAAPRPNILFLFADDMRPDTIAALGNPIIKTPHLDELVRAGVVFPRATAGNPVCVTSRAEIITGCSGFRTGALYDQGKVDPQFATWPDTLRKAGYHTWHVGKWHVAGKPLQRGYEETQGLFASGGAKWEVDRKDHNGREITGYRGWVFQSDDGKLFPEKGLGLQPNTSATIADYAIGFLKRKRAKPFFLQVNFTAPHDPLLMPPGYEKRYDPATVPLPPNFLPEHPFDHGNFKGRDELLLPWPRTPKDVRAELAVYYAVISHLDEQIGRIVQALKDSGDLDKTIIIFSSDQGLALGSHGLRGKQNMYEHTIGVPLILSGPGIPKGKQLSAQCYLRDLFPTTCELASVDIPRSVEGKSLVPVLTGKAEAIYPCIFGYFRDVQRMIRTDRWKLIYYPQIGRYQLFDLSSDPQERNDLIADSKFKDVIAELRGRLEQWQKEVKDPLLAKGKAKP